MYAKHLSTPPGFSAAKALATAIRFGWQSIFHFSPFSFCLLLFTSCFHIEGETKIFSLDTVYTQNGLVRGGPSGVHGIRVFKGIRYADAPVGAFRWKAPQPVSGSRQIYDALNFGDNCMQGGGGPTPPVKPGEPANPYTSEYEIDRNDPQSEDCLCLNIWTPAKTNQDKLPVLVFIHGGGLGGGSGSIPLYNGEGLAKKGIIVITINYRLTTFGFFSHPQLSKNEKSPGNFGLLDQVAALKWVRNNIYGFGGDPDRITIAGQSAGAWSVSALMATPLSGRLFHRAIAQSGGIFTPPDSAGSMNPIYSVQRAHREGEKFMKSFSAKDISELRAKSAKEILNKDFRYGFVADGNILPKNIYKYFDEEKQYNIPLLTGWTANDARGFGWQARTFANLMAKRSGSSVYAYYFTKVAPGTREEQSLGAYHSAEIAYAFNNLRKWNRPWREEDRILSEVMSSYWVNFIKTGNPNDELLPQWPEYERNNERSQELGDTIRTITTPGDEEYKYFNKRFLQ